MSKKKIYVGNGTEKFDGDLVEFSVNLSKVTAEAGEHIFENKDGQKIIKLKVVKKKEAKDSGTDQYGKTHYVEVDTWKPTTKKEEAGDSLPF